MCEHYKQNSTLTRSYKATLQPRYKTRLQFLSNIDQSWCVASCWLCWNLRLVQLPGTVIFCVKSCRIWRFQNSASPVIITTLNTDYESTDTWSRDWGPCVHTRCLRSWLKWKFDVQHMMTIGASWDRFCLQTLITIIQMLLRICVRALHWTS